MKIVGVILSIFLAINIAVSASAIPCDIDEALCLISGQNCFDSSTAETQKSTSTTTHSSHAHCTSFCAHYFATPNLSASIFFNTSESPSFAAYSFTFIQTFSEGPFRPPLS